MRNSKLRLNVDELSVESFTPSAVVSARGTVNGAQDTVAGDTCGGAVPSYCQPQSCDWTQCQNLSCLGGAGCGGGERTLRQDTCHLTCGDTNPPPIE